MLSLSYSTHLFKSIIAAVSLLFHTSTPTKRKHEKHSMQDLLARKNTRLHRHLQRLHADTSLLATDWFLCLYATALPPSTVLRVWDALLLEGPKVLYRVALAILSAVGPELLRIDNAGVKWQCEMCFRVVVYFINLECICSSTTNCVVTTTTTTIPCCIRPFCR